MGNTSGSYDAAAAAAPAASTGNRQRVHRAASAALVYDADADGSSGRHRTRPPRMLAMRRRRTISNEDLRGVSQCAETVDDCCYTVTGDRPVEYIDIFIQGKSIVWIGTLRSCRCFVSTTSAFRFCIRCRKLDCVRHPRRKSVGATRDSLAHLRMIVFGIFQLVRDFSGLGNV
jgi:hypothetical protein